MSREGRRWTQEDPEQGRRNRQLTELRKVVILFSHSDTFWLPQLKTAQTPPRLRWSTDGPSGLS
eukprot:1780905-Pyramimonas_sp.AAC.1